MIWIHAVLHAISGIQLLALGLAGGGIIALGAFAAPTFFSVMDRRPAGQAMTGMFKKFDRYLMVLAWTLLLTELPYAYMVWAARFKSFVDPPRWVEFMGLPEEIKTILILGFVGVSFVNLYVVNRQMAQLEPRILHDGKLDKAMYKDFQALHKRSEMLAKIQAVLALGALFVSPFADI